MPNLQIRISIFINYFLFAILLNSVGTVILQVQHYFGVGERSASILEAFKDISIAVASFAVASFITRIGYKKSMLIALGVMTFACFGIPFVKTFIAVKLLFAITGICFALTKVSVFGTIGLITKNEKQHISMMSFIESFFMIGILTGYFVFSGFIDDKDPASSNWFHTYYVLGILSTVAFLLLFFSPLDESSVKMEATPNTGQELAAMFKLLILPVVVSFVICAFFYVLIEQSIMSWLPTFNNKVLHLPASVSIMMSSILALSYAGGRFLAGVVMKKVDWYLTLVVCLCSAAVLVLLVLPLAKNSSLTPGTTLSTMPLAAFVFPLIGFFLAPIYPAINSIILSSLPKSKHGVMAGLIVVFSAIGGTLGSIITGFIFQTYDGQTAFYFSLVPMSILVIALTVFKRMKTKKVKGDTISDSLYTGYA